MAIFRLGYQATRLSQPLFQATGFLALSAARPNGSEEACDDSAACAHVVGACWHGSGWLGALLPTWQHMSLLPTWLQLGLATLCLAFWLL